MAEKRERLGDSRFPARASAQLAHQVTRTRHRAWDLRPSRRLRPVAAAMLAQADTLAEQLDDLRREDYQPDRHTASPPAPPPAQALASPRRGASLSSTIAALVGDLPAINYLNEGKS